VVSGIEDAAIYVGMSDNIQVAHNEVFASVAGIEIENSRHAIVENNMVYDNAGGILTFITPGLPIKTTFDVIIRDNFIVGNNHKNFGAPGSIVSGVPSGTGIVVMAADDVQIENNVIRDNKNAGIVVVDHGSFANITRDPEADPNPDRISIYKNLFANNGYEPIDDIKALMTLSLTRKGPDVVAVGGGKGSCAVGKSAFKSLGLSSWPECKKTSSAETVSHLLAKPVEPRPIEAAEVGKRLYSAVCAGCHAYNVRMIGPPTQIIQAMYADNPQGIADFIAKPIKKREDFPEMPPQSHLRPEHRLAVAKYMLTVKN
jgi:cytochrome c551/c552